MPSQETGDRLSHATLYGGSCIRSVREKGIAENENDNYQP